MAFYQNFIGTLHLIDKTMRSVNLFSTKIKCVLVIWRFINSPRMKQKFAWWFTPDFANKGFLVGYGWKHVSSYISAMWSVACSFSIRILCPVKAVWRNWVHVIFAVNIA